MAFISFAVISPNPFGAYYTIFHSYWIIYSTVNGILSLFSLLPTVPYYRELSHITFSFFQLRYDFVFRFGFAATYDDGVRGGFVETALLNDASRNGFAIASFD